MNRALSMLGLCARAGKLVSGEKACLQLIRGGGAFAVLIDASAAKNAVKSITDACAHHQVTLLTAPENELEARSESPAAWSRPSPTQSWPSASSNLVETTELASLLSGVH